LKEIHRNHRGREKGHAHFLCLSFPRGYVIAVFGSAKRDFFLRQVVGGNEFFSKLLAWLIHQGQEA
jgi:hypothetical protein